MLLTRRQALTSGMAAMGATALGGWGAWAMAGDLPPGRVEQFRALCAQTARANILDRKLFPSQAYAFATWLRDAYWTLPALADPTLTQYTWERFANQQIPATGQVPPALLHSDAVHFWADDESTALFLLMALDLRRAKLPFWPWPLEPATRYLVARVDPDGHVRSGPGPYAWWLDTLRLAERDTVAYTQGVTAVALRAAFEMGLPVSLDLVERTEQVYASLYRPDAGTMTLAARTTLLDVSCLVGEHLSQRYFNRSLLSDEIVGDTLRAFRPVTYADGAFLGFPVTAQLDGTHMPEEWFHPAPDNWPGYYHNGGSWLLYDAIALHVAERHAVPGASTLLHARLASETRLEETLHEYIATSDARGDLGRAPFAWRRGYSWNSYVGTLV